MSELGGGILLTFGLCTPLGAAAVLVSMLLAIASAKLKNRFFTIATQVELPLFYAVSAIGIAFTGGGAFSLDAKFGFTIFGELYFVGGVLVFAVAAAALALALRPNRDGRSSISR